jgi:UDP-N-acetylmuramoyl-L-alanyl-D-glutamate--2,6-diaminopimelate ligase
VRLSDLVAELRPVTLTGDPDVEVLTVDYDSRRVSPGSLFCCLPGARADGHDFAPEAVARGAVALLVARPLPLPVPQVQVEDPRRGMALAAAAVAGHPSRDLTVVGVTGTNGKTTTVHLLRGVLEEAGLRTMVLGTLTGPRTTPEAPDLQGSLARWRDEGGEAVAMEVSSHALALHRVDGTRFRVAVFTNLSRDHLDFHGTMEAYFEAKARLFRPELAERAVVNLDSPHGRLLRDAALIPTTGYRLGDVEDLHVGPTGSSFRWRGVEVVLPIGGRFNVSNALAAAETGVALGIAPEVVAAGLGRPVVIPGRFEPIEAGQPFTVIVDYAHTPDGLAELLRAGREVAGGGRVTVVFGCGGERDASKRPAMGETAASLADRVVLTADNSRGEDTGAIIDAVRAGALRAAARREATLVVEPDRRAAIREALAGARPGDVVLVAGKGHEATLTIGDREIPFDDRQVVREELARIAGGSGA